MVGIVLRGLTWGHRRAIDPLRASARAFAVEHPDVCVDWQVRSLSAFEHQSLAEAVRDVDLIVFDHPHCGDIARQGLCLPLDEAVAAVPGGLDSASYVGPSLDSYRWKGRLWAAPVDGATVHAVLRPDLMARLGLEAPTSWREVIDLAREARKAGFGTLLAARGHHALLTLASLMANLGTPWPTEPGEPFILSRSGLAEALSLMTELLGVVDAGTSLDSDAIDVHDLLAGHDGWVYCPAAYGYATYGEDLTGTARLGFSGFPGATSNSDGTVVGGAGVGVTVACRNPKVALLYVRHLLGRETQGLFPTHSGQPARIEAWDDTAVDRRFNGFFSAVRNTLETSWVRPRFAGYGTLEQDLAALLQHHLRDNADRSSTVSAMAVRAARVGTIC